MNLSYLNDSSFTIIDRFDDGKPGIKCQEWIVERWRIPKIRIVQGDFTIIGYSSMTMTDFVENFC